MTKKKLLITVVALLAILVVSVGIICACLFTKVNGPKNDTDYWSEYDMFDISKLATLEKGNEDFKILQLTDLHYHLPHKTKETDNIVKELVEKNAPDLIVITGDTVFGPTNMMYSKHVAKLMDSLEIPWAIVYGNHDEEGKADKFWMGNVYENSKFGLYENGPFNIGGTGNYAVNITKDGNPFYSIVMMDSNRATQYNGKQEYGAFTPSQVSWYGWLTDGLKAGGYDKSMMFFHIPVPEYLDAYEQWKKDGFDESGSGIKGEGVFCSPYNPGMFTKIKEKGATTHVFVGHDHVNNYSINYQDVILTYGMKSSRQFYYSEEMVGGTLISINDAREVTIEHKYVNLNK